MTLRGKCWKVYMLVTTILVVCKLRILLAWIVKHSTMPTRALYLMLKVCQYFFFKQGMSIATCYTCTVQWVIFTVQYFCGSRQGHADHEYFIYKSLNQCRHSDYNRKSTMNILAKQKYFMPRKLSAIQYVFSTSVHYKLGPNSLLVSFSSDHF